MQARSGFATKFICLVLLGIAGALVSSGLQPVSGNSSANSTSTIGKQTDTETNNEERAKYSLPPIANPVSYDLHFEPDLAAFTFTGTESIKIDVLKPSKEIVLNSKLLQIENAEINADDGGKKLPLRVRLEDKTEKAFFESDQELKPGSYELRCKFSGKLLEELRGFYRVAQLDSQQKKHWIAATQMEPTDARRMFPCFDEPAYKAVF